MAWLKYNWLKVSFIILLLAPLQVFAHPGRTASDGCHYCRTNCSSWGVPWNERHCHGGYTAPVYNASTPVPTPVYTFQPTKTPVPTSVRVFTPTPTPKTKLKASAPTTSPSPAITNINNQSKNNSIGQPLSKKKDNVFKKFFKFLF